MATLKEYTKSLLYEDCIGKVELVEADSIVIDYALLQLRLEFILDVLNCMHGGLGLAGFNGIKLLSCYRTPETELAAIELNKKEEKISDNAGTNLNAKIVTSHAVGAAMDLCLADADANVRNIPKVLKYIIRFLNYHLIPVDLIADLSNCQWQGRTKGLFHIQFASAAGTYRSKLKYVCYEGSVRYTADDVTGAIKLINKIYETDGDGSYDFSKTSIPAIKVLPGTDGNADGIYSNSAALNNVGGIDESSENDTEEMKQWKIEHNWSKIIAACKAKAEELIKASEYPNGELVYNFLNSFSYPSIECMAGADDPSQTECAFVDGLFTDTDEYMAACELINAFVQEFGSSMDANMDESSEESSEEFEKDEKEFEKFIATEEYKKLREELLVELKFNEKMKVLGDASKTYLNSKPEKFQTFEDRIEFMGSTFTTLYEFRQGRYADALIDNIFSTDFAIFASKDNMSETTKTGITQLKEYQDVFEIYKAFMNTLYKDFKTFEKIEEETKPIDPTIDTEELTEVGKTLKVEWMAYYKWDEYVAKIKDEFAKYPTAYIANEKNRDVTIVWLATYPNHLYSDELKTTGVISTHAESDLFSITTNYEWNSAADGERPADLIEDFIEWLDSNDTYKYLVKCLKQYKNDYNDILSGKYLQTLDYLKWKDEWIIDNKWVETYNNTQSAIVSAVNTFISSDKCAIDEGYDYATGYKIKCKMDEPVYCDINDNASFSTCKSYNAMWLVTVTSSFPNKVKYKDGDKLTSYDSEDIFEDFIDNPITEVKALNDLHEKYKKDYSEWYKTHENNK